MPSVFYFKRPTANGLAIELIGTVDVAGDDLIKKLADLDDYYGHEVLVGDEKEIRKLHANQFVRPPRRVPAEHWDSMLKNFQPTYRHRRDDSESLMLGGCFSVELASIVFKQRVCDEWQTWELVDFANLTHDQILERVEKAKSNERLAQLCN